MINSESKVANYIEPVIDVLHAEEADYRILGGIASSSLIHAKQINYDQRVVEIDDDFRLTVLRENSTIRDVDVLINSRDKDVLEQIGARMREDINVVFPVSVFGYRDYDELMSRSILKSQLDFTTHRAMDDSGQLYYVAHPFTQRVSPATYKPWKTVFSNGLSINTLSPLGTQLAYEIRSINGLRPKDKEKFDLMKSKIISLSIEDEYSALLNNYAEWINFRNELEKSPEAIDESRIVYRAFRTRKKILGFAEKHQAAIDIAQGKGRLGRKIEPILGRIIGSY